ncbi:MAG: hypothetical protein CMJ84_03775 [Planctomycetes bacterium]|nr:hypothetical protein [Planctomycetota bacterium]
MDENRDVVYQGIDFEHTDQPQLELDATERACAHLMKKKQMYERSLGVKLELLRFFDDGPPRSRLHLESHVGSGGRSFKRGRMQMMEVEATPPNPFGMISFAHQVRGEFEISRK